MPNFSVTDYSSLAVLNGRFYRFTGTHFWVADSPGSKMAAKQEPHLYNLIVEGCIDMGEGVPHNPSLEAPGAESDTESEIDGFVDLGGDASGFDPDDACGNAQEDFVDLGGDASGFDSDDACGNAHEDFVMIDDELETYSDTDSETDLLVEQWWEALRLNEHVSRPLRPPFGNIKESDEELIAETEGL